MPLLEIDVIIASFGHGQWLFRCLQSLVIAAKTSSASVQVNLWLSSSGETSPFAAVVASLEDTFPGISIRHGHSEKPLGAAAARNQVLHRGKAPWIYFIDDDAFVDEDFFERFQKVHLAAPQATVVGGPNLTCPTATEFQRASGAVLGSRFAASRCAARYKIKHGRNRLCGEESLISCNLFVARAALQGLSFPEGLRSNEENWLLQDLRSLGQVFTYDSELYNWHERRGNVVLFARQIYKYGMGRGQNIRQRPSSTRWDFLIPALCLLIAALSLSLSAWDSRPLEILRILLLTYMVAWLAASFRLEYSRRLGLHWRLFSAMLFPLVHVCYGYGVLRGLVVRND